MSLRVSDLTAKWWEGQRKDVSWWLLLTFSPFSCHKSHRGCAAFQTNCSYIPPMKLARCLFFILPPSLLLGVEGGGDGGGGGGSVDINAKAAMKLKGLISGQPSCLFDSYCEKLNHRETHKSRGAGNRRGQSNLLHCNPPFIHQNSQKPFAERNRTN